FDLAPDDTLGLGTERFNELSGRHGRCNYPLDVPAGAPLSQSAVEVDFALFTPAVGDLAAPDGESCAVKLCCGDVRPKRRVPAILGTLLVARKCRVILDFVVEDHGDSANALFGKERRQPVEVLARETRNARDGNTRDPPLPERRCLELALRED